MNQSEIDYLIKVDKHIIEPPQKDFKINNNCLRKDFKAQSVGGESLFTVFLRQNIDFNENFSVGLIYHSIEGKKIMLLRMNGNHGETVQNPLRPIPHFNYHIHKITPEEIENGNITDPKFSLVTDKYVSFEQAIRYFMIHTNILDSGKYFPNFEQLSLFDI